MCPRNISSKIRNPNKAMFKAIYIYIYISRISLVLKFEVVELI